MHLVNKTAHKTRAELQEERELSTEFHLFSVLKGKLLSDTTSFEQRNVQLLNSDA